MHLLYYTVLAFFGSLMVGVLFNSSKKALIFCGLSGLFGYLFYALIYGSTFNNVLATFIGAIVVSLFGEIMSKTLKIPSTIFIITGIFPIVPGAMAYNTIELLTKKELQNMASSAFETIFCAGALAFGIMVIASISNIFKKLLINGK